MSPCAGLIFCILINPVDTVLGTSMVMVYFSVTEQVTENYTHPLYDVKQNTSVNLFWCSPCKFLPTYINRGGDLKKQDVKVTPKEHFVKFLGTLSLLFVKICRERQCETDSRHVEKSIISPAQHSYIQPERKKKLNSSGIG